MTTSIEVGMGATVHAGTDASAYTVIAMTKSGKTLTLQKDKATLLNGPTSGEPDALVQTVGGFAAHTSGTQRYEYARDPEGALVKVSLRKDGRFRRVGSSDNWQEAVLGKRYEFYDYNF